MNAADVTAVLVTRGGVDLAPIFDTLVFTSVVVWDNSVADIDRGAFGRYWAALRLEGREAVYFQDDDCVVPAWAQRQLVRLHGERGVWVSNMPEFWNGSVMPQLALPGWGCVAGIEEIAAGLGRWTLAEPDDAYSDDFCRIGCDIAIPVLCESMMVDLGHLNLPHAEDLDRTCKRPDYQAKKRWYYERAVALR